MEDVWDLSEFNEEKMRWLNGLFRDLNVLSVITFLHVFIFLPLTAYYALSGRPDGLLYTAPWLVPMIAYWYWRFRYLRVSFKRFAQEGKIIEYERALKRDSVRTVLIGAAVTSTFFFFISGGDSVAFYGGVFIIGLLVFSTLVGISYLSFWVSTRQAS
jgi:hypothetical protein